MVDYGDSLYLIGKVACYMLGDKMSCTKLQNVREGSSSFSALMAFQLHSTRNVVSSSYRDLDHLKILDMSIYPPRTPAVEAGRGCGGGMPPSTFKIVRPTAWWGLRGQCSVNHNRSP